VSQFHSSTFGENLNAPCDSWACCIVKFLLCPECRQTKEGREYTGTVSTTVSGRTCQEWASTMPHMPNKDALNDANYPDGSRSAARNYCRNPDRSWPGGLWCYTTDQYTKWEECDVPLCSGRFATWSITKLFMNSSTVLPHRSIGARKIFPGVGKVGVWWRKSPSEVQG